MKTIDCTDADVRASAMWSSAAQPTPDSRCAKRKPRHIQSSYGHVRLSLAERTERPRRLSIVSTSPPVESDFDPDVESFRLTDDVDNRERCLGALLGLACGDALGTTLEFRSPGTFAPISDMVGGGPFGLQPGQWTDDTSMALCLAESLIECRGFDPIDQLERYVRWWRDGHLSSTDWCFDIGTQTSAALAEFEASRSPEPLATDPISAGNGSIMRLAPVPMAYHRDIKAAIEHSARSSSTTHPAPSCLDACRYLGALIAAAVTGTPKDELLAEDFWRWGALHPEIEEIAHGSFRVRQPPQIEGTGFVVRSLEAALWALQHSRDFRDGALLAVNLGDDADTTGAVYGQLAGAVYGPESIPTHWRQQLALRETIEDFADRLTQLAG